MRRLKLYRAGEGLHRFGKREQLYVCAGEKRPPKRGEYYLSGAPAEAYEAFNDLDTSYIILRRATNEEMYCPGCGQRRKME